jgi:hypothetical protein
MMLICTAKSRDERTLHWNLRRRYGNFLLGLCIEKNTIKLGNTEEQQRQFIQYFPFDRPINTQAE